MDSVFQSVFTFGWDVDKCQVTKFSKLFTTEHFAPNPDLVIDVCLKSVQRAMGAFYEVDLS